MIELFVLLVAGHYLADFALQNQFVAEQKNNAFVEAMGTHCLVAHSFHHALVAGAIAGVLGFAWWPAFVLIGATHFIIDLGKIRDYFGINTDQLLHLSAITTTVLLYR